MGMRKNHCGGVCHCFASVLKRKPSITASYKDEIILSNFIFTGLHGYQITPGLSVDKQRHRLLLLKTGIHVTPTYL